MVLLLLGIALVLVAAAVGAAFLAGSSLISFVLATYVLGFTEVVAGSLVLSPFHDLTASSLLILFSIVALAALGAAIRWRPPLPPFRQGLAEGWAALHDRALAALAAVTAAGLGYSLALALFTPANDDDALLYHLTRAALWHQQHAVGYVTGIFRAGVNTFPPYAEIAMLFTMLLSGGDRFVGLVQLLAVLTLALAVFGIGRRLGLGVRGAMFGALVVPTLPIVALQASTALNDVVVAALLTVSVYFLLGRTRVDLLLAALALGLALGTKFTAVIALPLVILLAALAKPPRQWVETALAGVGAVLVGSVWYFVNLYETGSLSGGGTAKWLAAGEAARAGGSDALFPLAGSIRLLSQLFDLSGGVGPARYLYLLAAGALVPAGLGLAFRARSRRLAIGWTAAAAVVAASILLPRFEYKLVRAQWKLWHALGRFSIERLTYPRWQEAVYADSFNSWFGPLGALIVAAAVVLTMRALRRRAVSPVAIALALAPFLWIVILAFVLNIYEPWTGRWVIFGMALAAATFGGALAYRPLAWATVALAAVTLLLAFVNYDLKPSGLTQTTDAALYVWHSEPPHSAWTAPRWKLESTFRPNSAGMLRIVEEQVPASATIAFAPSLDEPEPAYPFFGPHLSRTVLFVMNDRTAPPANADWVVVSPERAPSLCHGDWRLVGRTESGWRLFRRAGHSACAG